jgi:hypothetical protein
LLGLALGAVIALGAISTADAYTYRPQQTYRPVYRPAPVIRHNYTVPRRNFTNQRTFRNNRVITHRGNTRMVRPGYAGQGVRGGYGGRVPHGIASLGRHVHLGNRGFGHGHGPGYYHAAKVVGGTVILGTGVHYYWHGIPGYTYELVPSGLEAEGPPFDVEAFVASLTADGSAPTDDPEAFDAPEEPDDPADN